MKKKIIAMLLAMALVLSLLAGCGEAESVAPASSAPAEEISAVEAPPEAHAQEPDATQVSAAEEASVTEELPAEPEIVHLVDFPLEEAFEVSVSMSTTPSLTGSALIAEDGSELGWAKWLQDRTGADIQVDLYSFLDSNDKLNLMIASGDYTDIIVGMFNYAGGIDGAVEEEVLTNIAEYPEYIPDYLDVLFEDINDVAAAYSTEFNLTAFYGINDANAKAEYGPVIRQDWLDELGMESPETYDELHDVLVKFKENYDATLWITAYGGVPGDLAGGFNVAEYAGGSGFPTWVEDGAFKFAPTEEGLKDYLTMMHQWYEEDLIYPDFLSQGGADYPDNSLITTGDIGVYFTYVSYMEAQQDVLSATDPDGLISAMTWPVKDKGQEQKFGKAPNNSGVDGMGAFSVTTACEDIPTLLAIFNEFYTEEGYDFCNWGTEGETYVMEGNKHVFTEIITDDEYNLGANIMMTYYFFKDGPFLYNNDRYMASYSDRQIAAAELWTTSRSAAALSTMTTEQSTEYYTAQTDISTVYQEYMVKFIVGDKDLDADWQEFMDLLNGCGLQRFMELGQLGVDQYAERLEGVQAIFDEYHNG